MQRPLMYGARYWKAMRHGASSAAALAVSLFGMIGDFWEREMRKLLLFVGACLAIAGCSSTPTSVSEARPVAPEYVYGGKSSGQQDEAKLMVVRDSGFTGGGCRFGLFVDGQRLADLDPKETVTVYVKPGMRILGAGAAANARGLCAFGGPSLLREREANFDAGQERVFRISISSSGDLDISPMAQPPR